MRKVLVSFLSHTLTMWFIFLIHTHMNVKDMQSSRQAAIRGLFISELQHSSSINLHTGVLNKKKLKYLSGKQRFTEKEWQTSTRNNSNASWMSGKKA